MGLRGPRAQVLSWSAAGASFPEAPGTLTVSKGQPKEMLSSTRKQVPQWTMDPGKTAKLFACLLFHLVLASSSTHSATETCSSRYLPLQEIAPRHQSGEPVPIWSLLTSPATSQDAFHSLVVLTDFLCVRARAVSPDYRIPDTPLHWPPTQICPRTPPPPQASAPGPPSP